MATAASTVIQASVMYSSQNARWIIAVRSRVVSFGLAILMIGTILGLAVKSRYAERTTSGRMAECEKKTKSFQLLASELRVQPCREDLNYPRSALYAGLSTNW
jgi:hypothetical protein